MSKKEHPWIPTIIGYGALTPAEEYFCQAVASGMALRNAAVLAYNQANPGEEDSITPKKAAEKASRWKAMPRIQQRIAEIQKENAQMMQWTREDSIRVLASVAVGRIEKTTVSDRVTSVRALNAMHGWETKVVDHKSSDNSMSPVAVLPAKKPDGK